MGFICHVTTEMANIKQIRIKQFPVSIRADPGFFFSEVGEADPNCLKHRPSGD